MDNSLNLAGGYKLIVGLGNPSPQYAETKHNAGFWVVDLLAQKFDGKFRAQKNLSCRLTQVTIAGLSVLLAKPDTFMNESGKAVQAILHWYKELPQGDLMVVHDDVSLPLGKLRLQHNGGAGGHHGIESIIEHLGGQNKFDRLKFGVGPDPGGEMRAGYVLSKIPAHCQSLTSQCVETAVEALQCWLAEGIQEAMNKFNGREIR